jgi:hypothetical protein
MISRLLSNGRLTCHEAAGYRSFCGRCVIYAGQQLKGIALIFSVTIQRPLRSNTAMDLENGEYNYG